MKKKIKFQYFMMMLEENEKVIAYNLTSMINKINSYVQSKDFECITYDFGDFRCRIEGVTVIDSEDQFIGIRFLRLDEYGIPYISNNSGSEEISLQPDEYIGKDSFALYDKKAHILMFQNNKANISFKRLEILLSVLHHKWFSDKQDIRLLPIQKKGFSASDLKAITKLEFKTTGGFNGQGGISDIIRSFNKYKYNHLTLSLSLGHHKKGESLDKNEVLQTIEEIKKNIANIDAATISYTKMDGKTEAFDLFEQLFYDMLTFTFDSRKSISPDRAYDTMFMYYKNTRRNSLYASIGITD